MSGKIEKNSALCLKCDDEVESRAVGHLDTCSCGNIGVDGGREFLRRIAKTNLWQETSIQKTVDNN